MFAGHGSHLSPDAAALKKPGWHSANTKRHKHEQVNKDNWLQATSHMTQCTASSSRSFKALWNISNAVNFSPCVQDNKTEWTCYYVKAKGQIWTSDRDIREKTEAQCWLIKTLAKALRTLAQSWNKKTQTPCLAGTPLYFFNHNPPLLLLSYRLSLSQQTQPVIPHSTTVSQSSMLHYNKRNKGN